jgi:hypothetical protein
MTAREKNKSQTERCVRSRRNRRVKLRFPVTLEVPAGEGWTRMLKAHTIEVSHAGATLDMDEAVPVETGLQVMPPFGGTILAEVNDVWVDKRSGRHRISIRLIDPTSWTSPERLSVRGGVVNETANLGVPLRVWHMLAEYAAYLNEAEGFDLTLGQAAEKILEQTFLTDVRFQDWFAGKIMEDLQSWEEMSVRGGD